MVRVQKIFFYITFLFSRSEIKQIRNTNYVKALHMSVSKIITRTSVFLCILTYTFVGQRPTAKYVYVVNSFYSILKSSMNTDFPQAVTQLAETLVSLERIQNFLMFEEVHVGFINLNTVLKKIYTSTPLLHSSSKKSVGILLQNASAKWMSNKTEEILHDINFNVGPKQLVAVVGPVGSGKTSLLHAIMRELPLTRGYKDVVGRISYASQEPWLFPGTIRQNILFGEEWNPKKYEKVIKVCALERDFNLLPYGDRSIVGDRGISLSGGQRARINLARAVYKDADIYILDDPLSAVDTHVGKRLFEDCICGYLKSYCTVLVTHQLQYLRNVSKIYLMENGTIVSNGTYDEIRSSSTAFSKMFKPQIEEEECNDLIVRERSDSKYFENICDEPSEVKECRQFGNISPRVYKSYVKAAGGWCCSLFALLLFVIVQFVTSAADYFASFW